MSAATSPLGTSGPVLGVAHPLYSQYRAIWQQCLDVYEGTGGFLSEKKPYLIAHPREYLDHTSVEFEEDGVTVKKTSPNLNPVEPSPKLLERRKLARYENYAATLVDQLAAALHREGPKRTFDETGAKPSTKKRPIELFWDDADGLGTSWTDLMRQFWKAAGVFGHIVIYFDPPAEDSDRVVPIARAYTPLDVPDWLVNEYGQMTQIKLLEAAPRESFTTPVSVVKPQVRVRVVTAEGWSIQDVKGAAVETGVHGFESLPVAVLYAKRRAIVPFIGKSVLGDPMNFIDLYNLVSEERELLRKQTFSILNVPVGPDGSIEREQGLIGRQSGTGNMLFTTEPADYISADAENVTVYHASIDRLIRSTFRSALLPWDTDSKDAEAEGSRRIKREDLNQQLASFADECQRVDNQATDLVYQLFYGPAWKKWRESDGLSINWPREFDVTPLEELIKQFTDSVHLDLGETATKEIKKRAARHILPNVSLSMQEAIDEEIDAMPVVTEEERRQEELQASVQRLGAVTGG
jgi:hypothetical protein